MKWRFRPMPAEGEPRPFPVFPRLGDMARFKLQPRPQTSHQAVPGLKLNPKSWRNALEQALPEDSKKPPLGGTSGFQAPAPLVTGAPLEMPRAISRRQKPVEPTSRRPLPWLPPFTIGSLLLHERVAGKPLRGGGGPLRAPSSWILSRRTSRHWVKGKNHRRRATGVSSRSISRTRKSRRRSWE